MSSFSSNAILAKARSMYSKRLTEIEYEELLKRRSIDDLVLYLKNETVYGGILSELKDSHVHRGQLELLLNKEIFVRLNRLIRYSSKKDRDFYTLSVTRVEYQLILTKIRLLNSDLYSSYDMNIPDYLVKYASYNLYGLLSVQNYDELLVLLKGTKYYDVLLKYKPNDDKPFDSNMVELEFKHIYYNEYIQTVNRLFKGKKKDDLLTMINTLIELQNITKIYRLKKYFKETPEQIRKSLFLENTRIPKKELEAMIEAKDANDFLKKLANSSYKLYIDNNEFVYIEYYTEKIKYNLAKRFMRFSTDSALVYMTYEIVFQIEIDNLKHIIEGLRYGESPSQIKSMLIY